MKTTTETNERIMRRLLFGVPGVYLITFLPDGRQYVGLAGLDCRQRFKNHVTWLRHGRDPMWRSGPMNDEVLRRDWAFQILEYHKHPWRLLNEQAWMLELRPALNRKLPTEPLSRGDLECCADWVQQPFVEFIRPGYVTEPLEPHFTRWEDHVAAVKHRVYRELYELTGDMLWSPSSCEIGVTHG